MRIDEFRNNEASVLKFVHSKMCRLLNEMDYRRMDKDCVALLVPIDKQHIMWSGVSVKMNLCDSGA